MTDKEILQSSHTSLMGNQKNKKKRKKEKKNLSRAETDWEENSRGKDFPRVNTSPRQQESEKIVAIVLYRQWPQNSRHFPKC